MIRFLLHASDPTLAHALIPVVHGAGGFEVLPPCTSVDEVNTVSTELAFHAMELGIRGILRKSLPAALQLKCLRAVQAGESWFERSLIRDSVCPPASTLTPRERFFLHMLAQGSKNQEIAREVKLSEAQVRDALSRLFRKIGVRDRFELSLYGLKHVPLEPTAADQEDAARAGDLKAIA
jgi:DNA-binding NarL/FixJ family response regulator